MENSVELEQVPEILQNEVKDYLKSYPDARIIDVNLSKSTPYKDKTIIDNSYRVYTEHGNLLTVFRYNVCSNPDFTDFKVYKNSMIAGDIDVFIKKSRWFYRWTEGK
ncbi:hypothetical protein V6C27_13705 [Peptococcaceae bacterium 1198_IL3148]